MSEDRMQDTSARQERVRRLKRLIVFTLCISILVPIICCIVLLVWVHGLNARVKELTEQLELLEQAVQLLRENPQTSDSVSDAVQTLSPGAEDDSADDADTADIRHKVYLTFDDGPSIYTDEILDILEEYGVKATFFVVGKEDERSKNAIQRIVEEGHTLGMHSYSHKYSELYASQESFETDFEKQRTYLEELTGTKCRYYRFPGGSSNTVSSVDMQTLVDYVESQDVVFFDWNIASGDGGSELLDVDTLVQNSTGEIGRWYTSVILLHDSAEKRTTVEALPEIIETIQAMEDTELLPITDDTDTTPVQHIHRDE
jgi:peptidoglycan/xylan/chitin deacetylase (PgdA/CDA1 family)